MYVLENVSLSDRAIKMAQNVMMLLSKAPKYISTLFSASDNTQLGIVNTPSTQQASVIGNVGEVVPDAGRIDSTDLLVHRASYTYNDYYHATNTFYGLLFTLPFFYEIEAAVQNAVSAAALEQALTALPQSGDQSWMYDLAEYLATPRFTPLPATVPTCYSFLVQMDTNEKLDLFKGTWRTRTQHYMSPRVLGVYTFTMVNGMSDMYAIYATKFHVHRMILDPVSMTQIQYDQYAPITWVAAHYAAKYPLGLTQDQVNNMYQNIFKAFNNFQYIIPVESVKIGKMLTGVLTNNSYRVNGDIRDTYPIDFLFTTTAFGGGARSFNLMNGAEWMADMTVLGKVKGIIENIGIPAQNVEYGDSYYSQVFPSWKETLTYTTFDSETLSEWEPMLGWPFLYIGFHFQDPLGPHEPILRAWNNANFNNYTGHTIDLNTGGTQMSNMFTRINAPEIAQGAMVVQYAGVKLPGHTDELYDLALVFGWFRMTPRMGMNLTNEFEYGDVQNYYSFIEYTAYYDSLGNKVRVQAVDVNALAQADEFYGWVGMTDHFPFASFYTPKARQPAGLGIIAKIKSFLHIAGNNEVDITGNGTEFWEKIKRTQGMYFYAMTKFAWGFTYSNLKKIFNPFLVEKQKNNPLNKPMPQTFKPDKDKTPNDDGKKLSNLDIPDKPIVPSGGKPDSSYINDKGKNPDVTPKKEVINSEVSDPVDSAVSKTNESDVSETIDTKPKTESKQ